MNTLPIQPIAIQGKAAHAALLALNNANAMETSFLTPQKWASMVDTAYAATCIGDAAAFLIAFDQRAAYDSVNFLWFRERLPRFVYVDRIVVSADHRGAGLARSMYEDLFERARGSGHDTVVCEVNAEPPNPVSDAFHARMGFAETGSAVLSDNDKTVRYFAKHL